jgi:hypothetical protein
MSFKDLEKGNHPSRTETPEEQELRARAAARHKAREAKKEEHRGVRDRAESGGAPRGEPPE